MVAVQASAETFKVGREVLNGSSSFVYRGKLVASPNYWAVPHERCTWSGTVMVMSNYRGELHFVTGHRTDSLVLSVAFTLANLQSALEDGRSELCMARSRSFRKWISQQLRRAIPASVM
jgi:hypothetical protein